VIAHDEPVRDAFRRASTEREVVLLARSGGEVPALLRSVRFGRPPWVVITLRDQTRLRRMEQELRRHERLATLGQLSAGAAHEIRNPLAGIGTSAQVLLGRFEPRDERARFVRVILDEVGRLDRIVTGLLQYARPRTPELRPTSLAPCIERVLELAADAITQAHVVVEVDVAPRLQPVYIDPDLVTQVLLNVTLNAVQAMPGAGTLRFEVRRVRRRAPPRGPGRRAEDLKGRRKVERHSGPGAAWIAYQQVRVIDTGVGIPRHALRNLFDPFFSTKSGGTGLGLSISQSIMQEHGGAIAIASREGHGTTVLLNFPMEKRHGQRREPHADARRQDHPDRRR
jgi:signal transduction histidine kinase